MFRSAAGMALVVAIMLGQSGSTALGAVALGPVQVDSRQINVTSMAEDGEGFLWVTSMAGLCRGNGQGWTCIETQCPPPLWADQQGNVWARCSERVLTAVAGHQVHRFAQPIGERDFQVVGVAQDHLFLATAEGTYAWHPEQPPRLVSTSKASAVARFSDTLWFATPEGLVRQGPQEAPRQVQRGEVKLLTLDIRGGAYAIFASAGHPNGDDQLHLFAPDGTPKPQVFLAQKNVQNSLSIDELHQLLWVASGSGISAYPMTGGAAVLTRSMREGLPYPSVTSQLLDSNGLWLGTPQGLARIRLDPPIRTVGREEGMDGDLAFSLAAGTQGEVWITQGVGLTRYRDGDVLNASASNGLRHIDLRSVAPTPDGSVFSAGMLNPLVQLNVDTRRFRVVHLQGQPNSFGIHMLRVGPTGTLWFGLQDGGIGRKEGTTYVSVYPSEPIKGNLVHDVLEDRSGAVWGARTDGSVVNVSEGQSSVFKLTASAPALCLHQDVNGSLWIGSGGAGLFRIKSGQVQHLDRTSGLLDDDIRAVIEDEEGWLWFSADRGIFRVERTEAEAVMEGRQSRVTSIVYRIEDGLRSNAGTRQFSPTSVKDSAGRLWFAMVAGAISINPKKLTNAAPPASIHIDDMQINGLPADATDLALPAAQGAIAFSYSAPSLWDTSRLRYRARLVGWNASFIEQGNNTQVAFGHVPPGRYTFEVQAYSVDRPSQHASASRTIKLLPPFYLRLWFQALAGLAALTAVALIIVVRNRRGRRLKAALIADRTRIAQDIHDSLEQDLTGVKMQVDAATLWIDQDPQRAKHHLARAGELVIDGMADMRGAIWGLRAGWVKGDEWAEALEQRLRRSAEAGRLSLTFRLHGEPRTLSALDAAQLVYIAREAVTNAIKHASASNLEVDVSFAQAGFLDLTIKDDGKGFDAAQIRKAPNQAGGLGLQGMHARAELLRTQLNIGPRAEGGTTLQIRVALGAPTEAA